NFMARASQLGILAVAAALLMIGGEFDLSIGSMVAFAGLIFAAALVVWQVPLGIAIIVTLLFAGFVGMVNAQIVIRTGLPSFIVTLAFLFILRGLSLVGLTICRSEEHTSELQSRENLVCRLLLEKKKSEAV